MLSILLINENKIVSRLFQLSSQKHNYDLEEVSDYTSNENSYNVVFVDSKIYDEEKLNNLRSSVSFDKLTYLGDKGTQMPSGFDLMLEKPFLPTDFVNLMNENFKVIDPSKESEFEMEEIEELDELDLDNLDDLELEDELAIDGLDENTIEETSDAIKDIDGELDLDDLEDVETPNIDKGIDEEILVEDTKEELAEMVAEIDDLDSDEKNDINEDIKEDIGDAFADIDELNDDAIVSEDLVKESIKEVEEESSDNSIADIAVTTAAAATVAAAISEEDNEVDDTLDGLNDVESVESEEEYIADNKPQIEDEFDSLNADEVEKVMSKDASELTIDEYKEEVIDEKIVQEDEKVVESNDLEELITRAVSKAVSKELILEALKDMDIVISLKPKES